MQLPNWGGFDFGDGIPGAVISDLHLGHSTNDTRRMCLAIKKSIVHSGLISRIKILFIAGDTYDHLLTHDDPNTLLIDNLIVTLFKQCERHGVVMRALRGTPSHDHQQTKRFEHLYKIGKFTFDFAYFDEVDVEHIESLDTSVLYVPDEYTATTQITQDIVKARMLAKGVERVDIACMHGMFPHQIDFKVKPTSVHDHEFYTSIVRYWILIGHIHKHSAYEKTLVPSSHDRLRMNEEDPKGFVVFTYKNEKPRFWFIENKLAHVHKTLQVYGTTVEEATKVVSDFLANQTERCFVRVEAETEHPLFSLFKDLSQKWPLHSIVPFPKSPKDKEEELEVDEEDEKWEDQIPDTPERLKSLVFERLSEKHGTEQAERSVKLLESCL